MNEPVVSGETNGIELFVSPLESGLELKEQKFKNGISGLEKSLKIQLLYKEEKITLSLSPIIIFLENIMHLSIPQYQDFIKQIFWEILKKLQ